MSERGHRKERIGIVVSDKMDKTIVVKVDRLAQHPIYKRVIRRSKKFKVHDEEKKAKIGDRVKIAETRPISKEKRWRLVEVLK
jgi:small subunit ribosomal protein S17